MASDPESQLNPTTNDAAATAANARNSNTAGRENSTRIDWLKFFITVAFILIFSIPGLSVINSVFMRPIFVFPYIHMTVVCLPSDWSILKQVSHPSEGIAVIYYKSWMKPSVVGRIFMSSSRLLARAGLLLSWWVGLSMVVPKLRRVTLLGAPLWVWSLLPFVAIFVYFVSLSVGAIPGAISHIYSIGVKREKNIYQYNGLYGNWVLVFYFGILLALWVGYFEPRLKEASIRHPQVFHPLTSICISLFIGSVLWFLKAYVLLNWSTRAIYRRFQPRILMTTVKFLYLGLMVGDFFVSDIAREMELVEEYELHSASQDYSFQKYIMSKHVGTTHLYLVSQYLTSLAEAVKPLQDQGLPELSSYLEQKITSATTSTGDAAANATDSAGDAAAATTPTTTTTTTTTTTNNNICQPHNLVTLLDCEDLSNDVITDISRGEYCKKLANVLHRIVIEQCPSAAQNGFTFDDLKKWMVDAQLNCVNMGRTLDNAAAIGTRFDWIISIIIFVVVVLMWLLISEIATTNVLVAIGTPFITFAFIFGDSAKTFFQGIIYCFGTHSFDVGDRCILDDTELEVERVGILTTKFIKIGSEERRMYPNAVLATKAIINKGWQPDPSDTLELKLDMSTFEKEWETLESKLERFFENEQQREVFQRSYEVTMEEVDDKIKVTIHFEYVLNVKEMTHSQCFLKKKRQRSIILKSITKSLKCDKPSGNGDSATPVNSLAVTENDEIQPSNTSGS